MTDLNRKPAIDLSRHHFMREWKDLVIFGTWLHNEDQEADEPALVIVPRYRQSGYFPVCIALSAAFKYNSPKYLARVTPQFVLDLGFEDSLTNAHKVADAIHSHLRDLLTMPESPTTAIVVGEATMDVGGRKRSIDVLDYETLAQA
jgi:hypothetical protein